GRAVPDREREHALEPGDAVGPVVLVEVDDRLAVACGLEAMAARLELRAERAVVVDLAVAHDPHRAGLVHQRLRAAGHVDDGEPAVSERRLAVDPASLAVRTALREGGRHPVHQVRGVETTRGADPACDPTHVTTPYGARDRREQARDADAAVGGAHLLRLAARHDPRDPGREPTRPYSDQRVLGEHRVEGPELVRAPYAQLVQLEGILLDVREGSPNAIRQLVQVLS